MYMALTEKDKVNIQKNGFYVIEFKKIVYKLLPYINKFVELGIGAAVTIIEHCETAFDKEKMIGELKEAEQSCLEDNDTCGVEAIEYAIDIVDKGGIE